MYVCKNIGVTSESLQVLCSGKVENDLQKGCVGGKQKELAILSPCFLFDAMGMRDVEVLCYL